MIVHTLTKMINNPSKFVINYSREEPRKDDQLAITENWTLVLFRPSGPHIVPLGFPCANHIVQGASVGN